MDESPTGEEPLRSDLDYKTPRRTEVPGEAEIRDDGARVIVVTSPPGSYGMGRFALEAATQLGLRMKDQGRGVCLVNASGSYGEIERALNCCAVGLETLYAHPEDVTLERIGQHLIEKPELGLTALLSASAVSPVGPMSGARLRAIASVLREKFSYVVVLTPPAEIFNPFFTEFSLLEADFTLIPCCPSVVEVMNATSWLHAVTRGAGAADAVLDPSRAGVVLVENDGEPVDLAELADAFSPVVVLAAISFGRGWRHLTASLALRTTQGDPAFDDAFKQILSAALGASAVLGNVPEFAGRQRHGPTGRSSRGKVGW